MKKLPYLFLLSITLISPLTASEPENGTLIQISSVSIFTIIVYLYCARKSAKENIKA